MPLLPIIALEIASIFVISSSSPASIGQIKQKIHHVFPAVFAQDEQPVSDQSSSPQSPPEQSAPATEQTPQSSNQSPPSSSSDSQAAPSSSSNQTSSGPSSDSSTAPTSQPTDTNSPSSSSPQSAQTPTTDTSQSSPPTTSGSNNTTDALLQEVNNQSQAPTPEETPSQNQNALESVSQVKEETVVSNSEHAQTFSVISDEPAAAKASSVVLTEGDVVGGPAENLDQKVETLAQKQDEQIAQAQTPSQITNLSLDFAKESVKEVENHLRTDDFSTTSFVSQRLSDHIDTVLEQAQKTGSTRISNQLKTFCQQVDPLLRSEGLVVPEEAEQDFAIIRGKCFTGSF